jgi:MFS family permease
MAEVDSLWVQGTAAVLVGMVAALPCAIFGGMVGDFIGGDPDGNGTPRRALVYSLIGLAVGGAMCGTAGTIFGSFIPRWRLEYARSGGRYDQVQGGLP